MTMIHFISREKKRLKTFYFKGKGVKNLDRDTVKIRDSAPSPANMPPQISPPKKA